MRRHCSEFFAVAAVPRKCTNYCHLNLHLAASPLHLLSPLDPALSGNRSASVVKLGQQSLAMLSPPPRQCRLVSVSLNINRKPIHATNMEGLVRLLDDNTANIDIGNITGLDNSILINFFNVLLVKHRAKTLCRFPTPFTMPRRVPRTLNLRHYSVV
ncbi:hypothetical protein B0H65DRAFT_511136 [Neurospora tetraspora]|uniref:Uncharacterized protein n=1 Tax=Neurospora tetraspora TaxID=94610 RepID=A0AAE0J826_9PEZI|nr:hypothetical protein B0H65DRAFT_511136 [Neurospora tetraspora]